MDDELLAEEMAALAAETARVPEVPVVVLPVVPEGATLAERARVYEPIAMDRLAKIVADPRSSGRDAVAAAGQIMDRSSGKAAQSVVVSHVGMTLPAILEEALALRARMYSAAGGSAMPVIDVVAERPAHDTHALPVASVTAPPATEDDDPPHV